MRIAFDYQIFSLQAYGGVSRYFVRLVEQLSVIGQDAKVFAPLYCNDYLADVRPSLKYGCYVGFGGSKAIRLALPLNHWTCKNKISTWKADIVHETYFSMFNVRPVKCPVVVTVYDMVHELFPSEFSKINRLSHYKRNAVSRADHVICISESTRRDLLNIFDVPHEKVSVVHLGFDDDPSPRLPSTELFLECSQRPFLLFVGKRSGYKNFSGLLEAIALSPPLKSNFDILAFGGGAFTSAEQALVESLGYNSQQVRQVNGNDSSLGLLYDSASAFVYPSRYEGFGLPPLEAMAHNCPVVVSKTSSIPEVVGDAGEYFEPSSPESMAAAIERVVCSKENASFLVSKGRARLKAFSWKTCAEETLMVYKGLLN